MMYGNGYHGGGILLHAVGKECLRISWKPTPCQMCMPKTKPGLKMSILVQQEKALIADTRYVWSYFLMARYVTMSISSIIY